MTDEPFVETPAGHKPEGSPPSSPEISEPKKRSKWVVIVLGLWAGVFLGVLILVILAMTGVISSDMINLGGGGGRLASAVIDKPAPDFELENMAGGKVKLSNLKGKLVVINFWATWCGPCVREMPMLQEYQDLYPDELIILGIDMQESRETVQDFLDKFNLTYTILLDFTGKVGQMYQVFALPNTLFVDKDGILRYHHIGYMSEAQFDGYLKSLGLGSQ